MWNRIDELNRETLDRLEREWLNEPDEGRDVSDAPKCEDCGECPDDDYLYHYVYGDEPERWLCADCLCDKHVHLNCRDELKYCEECGEPERTELYFLHTKAICMNCLFQKYEKKDIYLD